MYFSKTQLFSMKFNEIVDTYSIPREAGREIVYLVRSMLKTNACESCISSGVYFLKWYFT